MLRQEERVIRLDQLLRNRDRTTAQYLADELEVSERTVRSDITFLKTRLHAPILYGKKQGFYYEDPAWRLSTYPLTQGELFALTLGARMLKAYSGTAYRRELETAIARLSERLPEQNWVDLQKLSEEHMLFSAGATLDLDPVIWNNLENACHRQQSVMMTYYTASRNSTSDRVFDPYLLHIYRGTKSDWIASNPDEKTGFPYANDQVFAEYAIELPDKARRALTAIGWTKTAPGQRL